MLKLLDTVRPDILHFSGHGKVKPGGHSAIMMEDEKGTAREVSAKMLGRIFQSIKRPPRCVFLNSCYSEKQVAAIKPCVQTIVGTTVGIFDKYASIFAVALYRYLAQGRTVGEAFAEAATQFRLEGGDPDWLMLHPSRGKTPRFFARPELHAAFQGQKRGKLMAKDEHFDILLWLEGAEDFATSATYEICDKTTQTRQQRTQRFSGTLAQRRGIPRKPSKFGAAQSRLRLDPSTGSSAIGCTAARRGSDLPAFRYLRRLFAWR